MIQNPTQRLFHAAAAILVATIATGSAAQASDSAVVEGIGLTGRWAQDCQRPASATNIHVAYTAPDVGLPTETLRADDGDPFVTELHDVKSLKGGKVQWTDATITQTFVIQMQGNRMRTWSVSGPGAVENGKSASGAQTPWLNKCETN
jgi:hypothetical protein